MNNFIYSPNPALQLLRPCEHFIHYSSCLLTKNNHTTFSTLMNWFMAPCIVIDTAIQLLALPLFCLLGNFHQCATKFGICSLPLRLILSLISSTLSYLFQMAMQCLTFNIPMRMVAGIFMNSEGVAQQYLRQREVFAEANKETLFVNFAYNFLPQFPDIKKETSYPNPICFFYKAPSLALKIPLGLNKHIKIKLLDQVSANLVENKK